MFVYDFPCVSYHLCRTEWSSAQLGMDWPVWFPAPAVIETNANQLHSRIGKLPQSVGLCPIFFFFNMFKLKLHLVFGNELEAHFMAIHRK